jgi:hypothetical protein
VPDIPLAHSDYFRGVAKEAQILTRNRYFEADPALTVSQAALIARPGMRRFLYVGPGPIRSRPYSQPGSFADALFVVSGDEWWRVDKDGTKSFLLSGIQGGQGSVSMAATGTIGATPEFLYLADGTNLFLYIENGFALGTISGTPANNDTVIVDTVHYKFTNAGVNVGAPAGTLANPWLVALGASTTDAWQNLADAFGAAGVAGTQYSTALTANSAIQVRSVSATTVGVRATAIGALGNAIVTTETGGAIAWTAATLTGGGDPTVTEVATPDDVGVISLGYIAGYIVVVPAQGAGINGRFFWIEPGETTIDPLNFATAERAPDPVLNVTVFGDQFWLPGSGTVEVWYFTGNLDSPVERLKGVAFDRGVWEGTALQIKESMVLVDSDGGVFQFSGGLERISQGHPDIEERIRKAIQYEASQILY